MDIQQVAADARSEPVEQPLDDSAQMLAAVLDAIKGMESRLRELILMKG